MANRHCAAAKRARRATGATPQQVEVKEAAEMSYRPAPVITSGGRKNNLKKDVVDSVKTHRLQKLADEFEEMQTRRQSKENEAKRLREESIASLPTTLRGRGSRLPPQRTRTGGAVRTAPQETATAEAGYETFPKGTASMSVRGRGRGARRLSTYRPLTSPGLPPLPPFPLPSPPSIAPGPADKSAEYYFSRGLQNASPASSARFASSPWQSILSGFYKQGVLEGWEVANVARVCATNLSARDRLGMEGVRESLFTAWELGKYRDLDVPDEVFNRFEDTDEGRKLGCLLFKGDVTRDELKHFTCRWWKVMAEGERTEESLEGEGSWGNEDGKKAFGKRKEPGRVDIYGGDSSERNAAREWARYFEARWRQPSTEDLEMDELPPLLPLPDMAPGLDRFPDGDINPFLNHFMDIDPLFRGLDPFAEPIRDPSILCEIDSDFDSDGADDMDELIDEHNTWVEGILALNSAPDGYHAASEGDAIIDEGMISDDEAVESIMVLLGTGSRAETKRGGRSVSSREPRRGLNPRRAPRGSSRGRGRGRMKQ
ncbi:hypothetical protein MFIFM68171_05242 [Madurella fahalii]|uniref:Uncharacterized protein n=1 Tax=Madurella fahalii TaxID=1157608 RepID=A0ABQ0GB91_9PEZI